MNKIKKFILSIPNLAFAYLFGSRATNKYNEDSDFDICIVINDDNKIETRKLIVEFSLNNKEIIQPLILTENEFREKIKLEVYKNEILNHGVKIKKQ